MNLELLREKYERVAFAAALLLLAGSITWSTRQHAGIAVLRRERVSAALIGPVTPAVEATDSDALQGVAAWPAPVPQPRGPGWRYEIFAPPAVYYHESNRTFALGPPVSHERLETTEEFELIEVKRRPYRMQLVGCVGEAANYVAVLSAQGRSETFLAHAGERIADLGIALNRIEVRNLPSGGPEMNSGFEAAALAILHDELTGDDVALDSRSQRLTDELSAFFKARNDAAGIPRELAEGDVWRQGGATCRIARIELAPPRVLVERTTDAGEPEQVWFSPGGAPVRTAGENGAQSSLPANERVVSVQPER